MITTSSPSYHNVFCPTAGTYSSYYFDALRANSRRSNKRVSLVKNTISRAHPLQQQQLEQQKSVIEKKKSSLVNKANPTKSNNNNNNNTIKKKSVRFSDGTDQVRLFYQWQTPQHQASDKKNDIIIKNDNVPHQQQQQQHQLTSTTTMTVTKPVLSNNIATEEKTTMKKKNQLFYQLELVNHCNEEKMNDIINPTTTITKKDHPYQPLELKSIHVVQPPEQQELSTSSVMPMVVGTCHVANVAFEKHVMVRYTFDDWSTFTDMDAMYCESLADSTLDRFTFEFRWKKMDHDDNFLLQFALRYSVNGMEFWDNNHNENYCARLTVVQPSNTNDENESQQDQKEDQEKSTEAPWASSSRLSSNLSSATCINPWTTSSFWTRRFPNNNNNNNTDTSNTHHHYLPSSSQQFQQPIHPPQHLIFSSNSQKQHFGSFFMSNELPSTTAI
ncbi:putative phosphatase regulatory subunit-domain-containing protein [Phascolomyces articulosus]|uniref:Phosphatase regulatory subunit-domain-containing protein n=1 Tax=Phascolomyces articulosus TaxID=60185 RepID=A0AAD5K4G3_9FUNG|nr:putative phosphatase regulatory subunit-domain-containing protein [Phascolomyces articulosus]